MRLLLDEHFPGEIARQLVDRFGHDVRAVESVRALRSASDPELLETAVGERRAFVTENASDFVPLYAEWARSGRVHLGIVITTNRAFPRGGDPGRLIRALDALLRANPSEDALTGMIRWLRPSG